MTKEELTDKIIEKEWEMFHNVNGSTRAGCQEDRTGFEIMRRAQYDAWDMNTVACFYEDISAAEREGRNLSREKYIRMMESTDPAGYEVFKGELPPVSAEKAALVSELWSRCLAQTVRMREKYPCIARGGRPTSAGEENGWASVETYQTSEALTYSEATLRSLLDHVNVLEAQGIDLAFEIQKNTVLGLGFASMDEAEKLMAARLECAGCGERG